MSVTSTPVSPDDIIRQVADRTVQTVIANGHNIADYRTVLLHDGLSVQYRKPLTPEQAVFNNGLAAGAASLAGRGHDVELMYDGPLCSGFTVCAKSAAPQPVETQQPIETHFTPQLVQPQQYAQYAHYAQQPQYMLNAQQIAAFLLSMMQPGCYGQLPPQPQQYAPTVQPQPQPTVQPTREAQTLQPQPQTVVKGHATVEQLEKLVDDGLAKAQVVEPRAQHTQQQQKPLWSKVASKGAQDRVQADNAPRSVRTVRMARSDREVRRKPKSADTIELEDGQITGSHLQEKRPRKPWVWVCYLDHTEGECRGEEPWRPCVNIHGDPIPGGISPLTNAAAHRNAVSDQPPTNANFCTNKESGEPDIHGCGIVNCPNNHVGRHERDRTVLEQAKRRPRGQREHHERTERTAVGADGNSPEINTLSQYADGLEIDEDVSAVRTSADSIIIPAGSAPVILKRSIGGVPNDI